MSQELIYSSKIDFIAPLSCTYWLDYVLRGLYGAELLDKRILSFICPRYRFRYGCFFAQLFCQGVFRNKINYCANSF